MNENNANFTPVAPNFKTLVRMSFQGLTNFPYIEEDFDALTNYELLSKVVEYLNEVISNNNEQNETITNLYNAYVSLQTYVNNYFDNLDVQEEINNKLDAMAASGELTNLIKDYVDPLYSGYVTEINSTIDEQNNNILEFKDSVNGRLNTMDTKIDNATSGSPLVATSTSEMTDTSRIYVNTTDGYWYYYNGSAWTQGDVYQSTGLTLSNPILQTVANKITTKHFDIISELYYNNAQLVGYTNPGFDADLYASGSGLNYNTYTIDLTTTRLSTLTCKIPDATNTGVCVYYTDLTSRSRAPVNVAQLNGHEAHAFISYDANDSSIFKINIGGLKADHYTKIYICYKTTEGAFMYGENIFADWLNGYVEKNDLLYTGVNIFNSIGALGDSYTAGATKHSDATWTAEREHSYIATMGKNAGVEWANYGVSGATTRSYLTNGLPSALAGDPHDMYFMCFGINDQLNLGDEYIGTVSDIGDASADTFYSNYGKIITAILNHSSNARICLIKIPINDARYNNYNTAIDGIANYFNIPVINPFDDPFFTTDLYINQNDGHPTIAAYVGMGYAMERLFSKCVMNNINYFRYSTVG